MARQKQIEVETNKSERNKNDRKEPKSVEKQSKQQLDVSGFEAGCEM